MAFFVAIVDIKILVMCMNGFLHAVLELPTSASERKIAPLGENSHLKEPTGRQRFPFGLEEGMERSCNLCTT